MAVCQRGKSDQKSDSSRGSDRELPRVKAESKLYFPYITEAQTKLLCRSFHCFLNRFRFFAIINCTIREIFRSSGLSASLRPKFRNFISKTPERLGLARVKKFLDRPSWDSPPPLPSGHSRSLSNMLPALYPPYAPLQPRETHHEDSSGLFEGWFSTDLSSPLSLCLSWEVFLMPFGRCFRRFVGCLGTFLGRAGKKPPLC